MGPTSETSVNFTMTWGVLEWLLTTMVTAGMATTAWVWRLGAKVERLEEVVDNIKFEEEQMRATIRSLQASMDKKINEETQRLESGMDRLQDKLDEFRTELPSRAFIEGQLGMLNQRLDRSIDAKLGRT